MLLGGCSQLWAKPQIQNVDFKFNGFQLVITYDINNASEEDMFDVNVKLIDDFGNPIEAKSLSGDIGSKVTGGWHKTIVWNLKLDNPSISTNIYVQISATERAHINKSSHILKSAIYPGLGTYRLNNRKHYFLYGLATYGALGGGIYMNQMAYNSYQSYLNASTSDKANSYFDMAKSQQLQSQILIGTSAAIWTYSMINTMVKVNKLKKTEQITPDVSRYYSGENNLDKVIIGTSPKKYFKFKGEIYPPNLAIDINYDVKFFGKDGEEIFILDADKKCNMQFVISNDGDGKGDAYNVKIKLMDEAGILGLNIPKEVFVGNIKHGETQKVTIPIETSINLSKGMASIKIELTEQNDFGPPSFNKKVATRKFAEPKVQVNDFTISTEKGGVPAKNEKIFLNAIIQNLGYGEARNVKIVVDVADPINVINLSETNDYDWPKLASGKSVTIHQTLLVKQKYLDSVVKVTIRISEAYGKFAKNKEIIISLKKEVQKQLAVYGELTNQAEIKPMLLTSDIDINIPVNYETNPYKFALVIGNEDYRSRQPNLNIESNVDFAVSDARIFKEYLNKTLGYSTGNIKFLSDATAGEMRTEISRLVMIISKLSDPSKAEIVFYYAGHGFPDEGTQIPYLIPVDVSANDLSSAISVSYLYQQLEKTHAGKITVFLDACFSGGGRNEGLIAARSVRIKPHELSLTGNIVVFSAASGKQIALPFKDQKHGYFTYYLLKKIQETKGDITYGELEKYIRETVSIETTKAARPQDPEVNTSMDVMEVWRKWKLR